MKAVLVQVGAAPKIVDLPEHGDDAFMTMRELVGGYLERVRFPGLDVYCDEDGLPKGLPMNRKGLVGTFVVLAPSPEWLVGLTDEEATKACQLFALEAV